MDQAEAFERSKSLRRNIISEKVNFLANFPSLKSGIAINNSNKMLMSRIKLANTALKTC